MNPRLYLFPTPTSETTPFVKLEDYQNLEKQNKLLRMDLNYCKIGRNVAASAWEEAQQKIGYLELACTRAEERAEIAEKHLDKIKKILNLPT